MNQQTLSSLFFQPKPLRFSVHLLILTVGCLATGGLPLSGQEKTRPRLTKTALRDAESQPRADYAIVIHGGAGSDPSQFSPEQNTARRKSLRRALEVGTAILREGGTSLDAVEATLRVMEDDPIFNAGRGAVFNARGEFELDASIMNGKDLSCGAVAGVGNVKNPISLARLVMTDTRHVLLSSGGAEEFAKEKEAEGKSQIKLVPNTYFQTPKSKARWERQQKRKNPTKNARRSNSPARPSYLGTVGCVALDEGGNLAAATSTGGLSNKKFGRVGDSPIVGAGTYADNQACGVSCTGIGEHFIRNAVAFDVAARMKYKKLAVQQAAKEVIHEVLKKNDGGLIALDRKGNIAIEYNTRGMSSAAADSNGRFEINWGKASSKSE